MRSLAPFVLALQAATPAAGPWSARLSEALVLDPVGSHRRAPLHADAVEHALVTGRWQRPSEGDTVTAPDGTLVRWRSATAGEDGWLEHGGWVLWVVRSDRERVALLDAPGASAVRVDGAPRTGDPYSARFAPLPVRLRAGETEILFRVGRGRLQASLAEPEAPLSIGTGDPTLPDRIAGRELAAWGALPVLNATAETARGLALRASVDGAPPVDTTLPDLAPLLVAKAPFRIAAPARASPGGGTLRVQLLHGGRPIHEATVGLDTVGERDVRVETFVSAVDSSVQQFAVRPAFGDLEKPALILSCHGAGVGARGQASAYSGKSWAHVVAPTNRRPFGFDWEDWGRLDAMEVLALAQHRLGTDRARTYLTGHSMGGHGAWHLAVTFPSRFAAVGPSAGWISFGSYGGARLPEGATPAERMLWRAASPSDTLALADNLSALGVYVLHGQDDDNVPVSEARAMRALLAGAHDSFAYHEEPGRGHWWDRSDEPGADCVDWAPLMDFFARHAMAPEPRRVRFTTASPGVSASAWWARIVAQERQLVPASIDVTVDPHLRRFTGTTHNVARLRLSLRPLTPGDAVDLHLDGQELRVATEGLVTVHLSRHDGGWAVSKPPDRGDKGPLRYGTFKDAFRRRPLLVHGTAGRPAEAAWSLARARLDAETFRYRGNGRLDIVSDAEFLASDVDPDRSVVLYGNARTNLAWAPLLETSPVQVHDGRVEVGGRLMAGRDLAVLLVRPRPGSDVACVAAVAGTGLVGMRLTDRIPYFVSGIAYPDVTVLDPRSLLGEGGVRLAGFFGLDWSLRGAELAWGR